MMTRTRFGKSIKTFKGIKKAYSKILTIFQQKRRRGFESRTELLVLLV